MSSKEVPNITKHLEVEGSSRASDGDPIANRPRWPQWKLYTQTATVGRDLSGTAVYRDQVVAIGPHPPSPVDVVPLERAERAEALLKRLDEWDQMHVECSDGPYWRREIAQALEASTPSGNGDRPGSPPTTPS